MNKKQSNISRLIWAICGLLALGTGILGIVLPILPTTPLVILAAFCFSKSSTRLHAWLNDHRIFGPMIQDWRERGAINPRAKFMAASMMALVIVISLIIGVPPYVLGIQAICLGGAALFVLTRPSY